MQHILSLARKAITDYNMIENGDKILVGVSGGKDSLVLLCALAKLRRFIGIDYDLIACTLDMGFGDAEGYSKISALCRDLDVEYTCVPSDIGTIVFDVRHEENPCSLCARMRRGALHDFAKTHGCNKVALGHHANDAAETLLMNLFNESRIGCFSPVTYLSRKDVTVIRPLIYAWEKETAHAARTENLPVVKNRCPADHESYRKTIKDMLEKMEEENPGVTMRVYGAIKRSGVSRW